MEKPDLSAKEEGSGSELPAVHVYVAKIPFYAEDEPVFPSAREREIEDCSNPKVRREKYHAWKLLERALRSLGLPMETLDVQRTQNGKWVCSSCFFSLSHSGNCVAVAVSEQPVGVDIEKWDKFRFTQALAEKIVTERERAALCRLEEGERATFLNALWTEKEAIFKLTGGRTFLPRRIETSDFAFTTKTVLDGDERYLLTSASESAVRTVFHCDGLTLNDFDIKA